MADELKASPENRYLAELSKALEWMAHPTVDGKEIKTRGLTIADLLPIESTGKVLGRLSRGEPLTTGAGGLGGTTRLQPDVRDFAMDVAPFAGDVAKMAGKGVGALGKVAGEELNRRFLSGQMFPYGAPTANFVVKPKGGNWLKNSVEKSLEGLKESDLIKNVKYFHGPEFEKAREARIESLKQKGDETSLRIAKHLEDNRELDKNKGAINQWIDKNLTNYVKNQMATPEDPVRKLAEKGIIHIPPDQIGLNRQYASDKRRSMEGSKLAKSPEAQAWEDATDVALSRTKVKNISLLGDSYKEPWHEKADPETNVYFSDYTMLPRYLGFDHIIDVLKEDLANGRLRPESLKNVSMEQAVSRAHEYNEDKAKKMAEAQFKITEGMPVVKEYPTGHKWIELAPEKMPEGYKLPEGYTVTKDDREELQNTPWFVKGPYGDIISGKEGLFYATPEEALKNATEKTHGEKAYQKLADALKYEGETMGHCVGGYCPDVVAGRSRIFSLRDPKGEPHVTVEVKPNNNAGWGDVRERGGDPLAIQNEAKRRMGINSPEQEKELIKNADVDQRYDLNQQLNKHFTDIYKEKFGELPSSIIQIKGKQNRAPNEQYLPFVQDFVKSGNWREVGDLQNTGLNKIGNQYLTTEELKPKVDEAKTFLNTHLAFEAHRQANSDPNLLLHPEVPYALNEMKAILNNPEEYDADVLPTALNNVEKLRGIYGDAPQPPVDLGTVGGSADNVPKMKRGGKVRISDNPDVMQAEIMQRGFAEGGTVQFARDWLQEKASQPSSEFHPIDTLMQNLQGVANLPERAYLGAKQLVTDPKTYFSNIKTPTPEELAMGFNPAGLEAGLGGMAERVGNMKAIEALFPNKTESMLTPAEKTALTKYKKDLDVPAVMRREIFRTSGTGDIETPSLKMRAETPLSPDFLENKYVVPILWDTSGAGTDVSQIAGVPLTKGLRDATSTSVQKQGGRLYPLIDENVKQGVAGASMEGAASNKINNLNKYSELGPTVGVVSDMAEHGIDFSHHIAEPYIGMLNALRPSNEALKAFRDKVRATPVVNPNTKEETFPYTKFPGIDSPNIRDIIRYGTNEYSAGNIRKAIAEVGDTYAMQKLGFPRWSDIYNVMKMKDAKTGQSAKTILNVSPNAKLVTPDFEHGSYNTGIEGTYAGGLADVNGNIVGVPDTVLLKRLFDEKMAQGKTIPNIRSSLLKSHHGQLMTAEDVARLREYLGYDKPKKAKGGEVHKAGGGLSKNLLKGEMSNFNENSKDSTMDAFLNLVPDVTSRFAPALATALYTPNLNSGEDAELARRRTMPANIQSPAGFDPRGNMGLGDPKFNKGGKVKRTVHRIDGHTIHVYERKL
jgi:PcfJ-like protein